MNVNPIGMANGIEYRIPKSYSNTCIDGDGFFVIFNTSIDLRNASSFMNTGVSKRKKVLKFGNDI